MFNIKTLNKISSYGMDCFNASYKCGDDIENPEAILVRSAPMADYQTPDSLLAIARAGAGVNNIPVPDCSKKGIVVFNTPGANANAVKEMVVAGLLISSRKIFQSVEWTRTIANEGANIPKLVEKGKAAFGGPEIAGKTLGVIGLGAIGILVANVARSLGMNVLGFDPYMSVKSAWQLSRAVKPAADLNEIYKNCDYITIHVPLNADTKEMINKDTIALMRDGTRILNFARAEMVSSVDVKAALESGKLSCYVTDFPTAETIGVNGIISIPHLGASTPESEDNCAQMAAMQIIDFLENGNIVNSVNLPECSMPRHACPRICVIHLNVPNMLAQISGECSKVNSNIENLLNKSKADYAYTMLDISANAAQAANAIGQIDGVIRVRVID